MIYFALFQYYPNMASTNRIMAYLKALSGMGVDVTVVFFRPDPKFSKYEGSLPHIRFTYLWDHFYINFPVLNKLSLRLYLKKFIQSLQPRDVVYVYGFPDLLVALTKRKDIFVYEERTEHNEVHFRGNIKQVTIPDFLSACRKATGVIVISQGLRQYYIENGCNPDKVHIVNMIVDSTRFDNLKKNELEKYIAYCGTASNSKDGVDQLIKAFYYVLKQYSSIKLFIIGSIPSKSQKFENLELVKKLELEDKVKFTGVVPSERIPQLLKDAAILALDRPNNMQAQYGFPTKLGEYLLTGNPVVITKVGDIPLFLKDGISALIAEPDNPQNFAQKICWLLDNPEEAMVIGKRGKQVAEISFNNVIETNKIVKIINNDRIS